MYEITVGIGKLTEPFFLYTALPRRCIGFEEPIQNIPDASVLVAEENDSGFDLLTLDVLASEVRHITVTKLQKITKNYR